MSSFSIFEAVLAGCTQKPGFYLLKSLRAELKEKCFWYFWNNVLSFFIKFKRCCKMVA